MPTLRRSKSLNDKIAKHKNRTGDVVRDPRSPEVEGRTRQCIDNFQALVHLRKQTEDKARQLELAISYASGGNTYIRRDLPGPAGGVELPYPSRKPSSAAAAAATGGGRGGGSGSVLVVRNPDASSKIPGPPPAVLRRQRSAEREARGAEGPGMKRRESLGQSAPPPPNPPLRPITQLRVRDSQRSSQRPLSMIEPRAVEGSSSAGLGATGVVAGGSLGERGSGTSSSSPSPAVATQLIHPVQEEMRRKDQVIQNLTESQKSLNAHNQQLLGKVDELEFLNHRLRDILEAHGVAHNEESFLKLQLQAAAAPHQPPCKPQRSQSLLCGGGGGRGETLAALPLPTSIAFSPVSSFKPALTSPLSPTSEASVSGYGSLASGDNNFHHTDPAGLVSTSGGTTNSGPLARLPRGRAGDYDDDTLPLSDISREGSLDSNCGKRDSVVEETGGGHSDRTDIESIHEKLDQVLELGKARESDKRRRIEELEEEVKALRSQRDTVVERFKLLVDEHVKQTARDGRVHEAVERLLERHGTQLQEVVAKQLQQVQEQLWDVSREVARHIALVLLALAASPASSSTSSSSSSFSSSSAPQPSGVPALKGSVDEQHVQGLVDKVVDLVGADYLRLGRYLGMTQPELERVEAACDSGPVKTRLLLHQWLQRRQREERRARREEASGATGASAVLDLALMSVDKDLRLFNHKPVSPPERQALANCLQCATEHVTDPSLVLDHLITLNELTPSSIAFVREMSGSQLRAVARLWHVVEYRETGVISRLALALQRAGYPHVAGRLTDELEIENSKLHSHKSQPLNEELDFIDESPVAGTTVDVDAPTTSTTPSGPAPSAVGSRPSSLGVKAKPAASMLPRPRSKAAADRAPCPARKPSLHSLSSSASKSSKSSHSSTSSSAASSSAPGTKKPTLGYQPDGRVGGEAANAALSPAACHLETPAVLQQPQLQQQQQQQQQQQPQQTVWDRRLPSSTGVSPRGGAPSVPVKSSALLERGSRISRV